MTRPRMLVFAYSDLGHACLKFLLDRGENVVGVYTYEDKTGENIWFPSVLQLARERGAAAFADRDLASQEETARVQSLAPELIFSFYYRHLIPESLLKRPRLGAFNMHGSLLPKYRGRAPVNWAVLKGEKETGATLHVMTARADAGDIVDQQAVPIGPDDTAIAVQARVTAAAVRILERRISELKEGKAPRRAQDHAAATKFGRRTPEDGRINWGLPALEIHNLVRAVTHPFPGAFTDDFSKRLYVWRTRPADATGERAGKPRLEVGGFFVACGDGREIEVLRAQFEGEAEKAGEGLTL